MKPLNNQNPNIMNSNDLFQMHRHHMNQASGTSSDHHFVAAQTKRKQQGRSSIRSGGAGATLASGYQTVSAGLRLADMSDEGSMSQLPHT